MGPVPILPVLIIDDEDVIRDLLRDVFDLSGIAATAVPDGSQALQALADGTFSVAFCDLRMPGLCGSALVEKLLEAAPSLRIVMMSGDDESHSDLKAALASGAEAMLSKPFRFKEVLAAYETILATA